MAMFGFIACDKHASNGDDHSAELVGTWTCVQKDFAEALIIKADGSVVSTGVAFGEFWENIAGNIVVENGNVTMTFEDHDNYHGHIDVIPGMAFSVYNDKGDRFTYYNCTEDFSKKVLGMWVSSGDNKEGAEGMAIRTYKEDGTLIFTGGYKPEENGYLLNQELTYKIVGDLMIQTSESSCLAFRLNYLANGTELGDILTSYSAQYETTVSWLRIKDGLDLKGKIYDYSSAYVSNPKGIDEDFTITGSTFNMANIKASDLDFMYRSVLYCLEFPTATTIKQHFLSDDVERGFETPITVDGNKVTLNLSAGNPAYRNVDMYMFQDADASQLHIYMPTSSFINYFANLEIVTLLSDGKIDPTNASAVENVYKHMEERIQSINVSFVLKVRN